LILNGRHLQRVLTGYVAWFNRWRPHRALEQRAPCGQLPPPRTANRIGAGIVARPVLAGL